MGYMVDNLRAYEFHGSKLPKMFGRQWFRELGDREGMIAQVTLVAARIAKLNGCEVDIVECTHLPSGNISERRIVSYNVEPDLYDIIIHDREVPPPGPFGN